MYMAVQAGAFSDHYVLSMPVEFGCQILSAASTLSINLLQLGFLTRGGVTIGKVHHHDNIIFGPALIEAVRLEEKEAQYPRLLCSDNLLSRLGATKYIIDDQLGRKIVNVFVPVGEVPRGRSVRDFYDGVWHIPGIERTIEAELDRCSSNKLHRYAENWRYMRDVLPLMLKGLDES
jgi:hypothetical protein